MAKFLQCGIFFAIFSIHLSQFPEEEMVIGYGGGGVPVEMEDLVQRSENQDKPMDFDILHDSEETVLVPESELEPILLEEAAIQEFIDVANKLSEMEKEIEVKELEDQVRLEKEEMEEIRRISGYEDAMTKMEEMEEADDRVRVYVMENGLIREEYLPDENDGDAVVVDVITEDEDDEAGDDDDLVHDEFLTVEPMLPPRSLYRDIGRPISSFTVDKRRRLSRAATVQLMAVVDNSIYRKFLARNNNNKGRTMINIRKYFTIVVAMANERFATIKVPDMKIKLVLSHIIVAKDRVDAPWVEYIVQYKKRKAVVSATKALGKFQKWLTEHKELPPYDHAMAFTSYKLITGGRYPASGLAQVAGMCSVADGLSSSIIVDGADYQCAYIIAHELGHSSPDASCLYDSATPIANYDFRHSPPGRMFSADAQCKLIFGKSSGLCPEPNLQKAICSRLWCRSPEDPGRCLTNALLYALPGTTCAVNLHCERMFCVPPRVLSASRWTDNQTSPPVRPPDGKFRHRLQNKTVRCRDRNIRRCIKSVRTNPSACRDRRILKTCCQSCSRYQNSS